MGKGFKHGASGAKSDGLALNFTLQAYPSEVELNLATPDAYTIGVITTNPIKGWYFSATQPENMAEGELWFGVGSSSRVAFNALKENTIMVYPSLVKQFVSGSLKDVKAKTYVNNAWVEWAVFLYNHGDECTDRTGGWTATKYVRTKKSSTDAIEIGTTKDEKSIKVSVGGMYWSESHSANRHRSGTLFSENAIDMSNFSKLAINAVEFVGGGNEADLCFFGVASEKKDGFTKLAETSFKAIGRHELDVSTVNTSAFVFVAIDNPQNKVEVTIDEISAE